MNMSINQTQTPSQKEEHPYKGLMAGIPGVVSMYLLDLNQPNIPYVDIYAEDLRRLNIQPDKLKGKPYDWHGTCSGIRTPRVQAIDEFIRSKFKSASFQYQYWDKGCLWQFDCRLIRLPYEYLLLTVSDGEDWQKGYWVSSAYPLESLNDVDVELSEE